MTRRRIDLVFLLHVDLRSGRGPNPLKMTTRRLRVAILFWVCMSAKYPK